MKKGQSLWEYAIVIVLASLVFVGMSTYFKRGVQGRLKDLTDSQVSPVQYVAGQTSADTTTSSKAKVEVATDKGFKTTVSEEESSRHSVEHSVGEGWEDMLP